jgi:hypothetical protein
VLFHFVPPWLTQGSLDFGQFAKENVENQQFGSNGTAQPKPLRLLVFSRN